MPAGTTIDELARLKCIVETQRLINSASLDQDSVLRVITERAQEITLADGGIVELVDGDQMIYRAVSGLASGSIGLRLDIATSLSGSCVQLGRRLTCSDTEFDPRVDREACRRLSIRSMVVVPLHRDEETIGVLTVCSHEPDHFGDDDVHILEDLAGFIADAITRASEYRRDIHNALHDNLTGLANRLLLHEYLEQACLKADRDGTPLAVFLLDLDGFKSVNDRFGHGAGDDALRVIAIRLADVVRVGDMVARYGGDEFVLVCEDVSEEDVYGILERVSAAVRSVTRDDPRFRRLNASVGMAWRDAEHRNPDELLSAADASMYRVKRADRADRA